MINYSAPNKDKKTIFIWPEGVFAGRNIDDLKNFNKFFKTNFSKNHLIIFGVNSKDKNNEVYNSLVVVNHKFEILYKYNKIKLVPFGEFLPFEKLLSKVGVKKITEGYGSFLKGKDQNIFVQDDLNILPLICYEIIFPNLIQKAEKEVNLIVNISEDAWFGGSIGPYQHFSKAIFRAIERDVFLVRAANKGVSAFINNKGQIIKILQPNETGSIELKVPLIKNSSRNKNDLIFFVLLFTFTSIFFFFKIKNNE